MNNLTIDDIHNIRREHAASTRNMSFEEYKADLKKEINPLLDLLKSMRIEKNSRKTNYPIIESSVVAESQATYQSKK